MKKILFILGFILLVGMPAFAATLIVTKTADTNDGVCDGDCSLREAIAVAQSGDVIQFQGGGIGLHQLDPGALAINKNNVTIDGGADHKVVIRGKHAEFVAANNVNRSFNCFTVKSSNNTFKGLVIQNCFYGIAIFGDWRDLGGGQVECLSPKGNKIENNYIGTNSTGDSAAGNYFGIRIYRGQENIVGPGNIVSGNILYGIYLDQFCSQLNRIERNLIGLKANGSEALPNMRYGVVVSTDAKANIIGGETPETRNIISGNNWAGIIVTAGASYNIIQGNYIGTEREGKKTLNNGIGVIIGQESVGPNTNNNVVRGNVISGNSNGIIIKGDNTAFNGVENNIIDKNIIGPAADLSPLQGFSKDGKVAGNYYNGIDLRGHNNIIGGETPEEANILTQNGSYGIDVYPKTHGNRLKINSIYENFYAGIRLAEDNGHNNIAKPAQIVTAEMNPAESDKMLIKGEGVKPSAKVDLYEFVLSGIALRERCQGKTFIGTTTADEAGRWEIPVTGRFNDIGTLVTAVQTDNTDGFSSFSDCFEIDNKPPHLGDLGDRGVTETEALAFNLHAVDANGNGLGYSCAKDCPEGLNVGEDGQVRWTPKKGDGGKTYNVTFAVADSLAKDEKIANIIVERFDTTPQLADLEDRVISEKDSLNFSLEAADEDGDAPTFVFAQGSREGMEFDVQTGTFNWSPKKEDIGEHRLAFRAKDNDKEHLFTEKEMKIEVKRKFPLPDIETKKMKVVRSGEKTSLIAQLKEQFPELQYTFRWEVKEGEGTVTDASEPEAEYIAPIIDEDRIEQINIVVEDSEGNISEETVSVVVLAKAEGTSPPEPSTTPEGGDDGDDGNMGNLGATEQADQKFGDSFRCSLTPHAPSTNNAHLLLWLLPIGMLFMVRRNFSEKLPITLVKARGYSKNGSFTTIGKD